MIYGLTGASGSGKTTLGQMAAESLGLTFQPTSITVMAERHGFNAVGALSLHDRIDLQYRLLDDIVGLIAKTDRPAILDRTPIDMIAYLLCEVSMHSHQQVSDKDLERVEAYVEHCLDATQMHFAHVFFVNRLDFYVASDTRPPVNPAYAVHTEIVMRGALARLEGDVGMSIIEATDINMRLDHVTDIICADLNQTEKQRAASSLH